jgi:hypothetical protein
VGYVDRLVREAIGMQLRSGRRIQINPSMEPCHEHYKPVTLTVLIILDRVARKKKNNRQRLADRQDHSPDLTSSSPALQSKLDLGFPHYSPPLHSIPRLQPPVSNSQLLQIMFSII